MTSTGAARLVEQAVRRLAGRPLLIAIDGASAAGTSTLAATLGGRLGATIVRGDDFCRDMGHEQRWALDAEEGYDCYFDWQRLRTEVLEPLRQRRPAEYQPFDWVSGHGLTETAVQLDPADVVLVDGVYSARPELSDLYALTVLVQTPDPTRLARLIARGDDNDEWWSRWDAAEKHYYANVQQPDAYDLVVPGY